jgi:hypothetical protein
VRQSGEMIGKLARKNNRHGISGMSRARWAGPLDRAGGDVRPAAGLGGGKPIYEYRYIGDE